MNCFLDTRGSPAADPRVALILAEEFRVDQDREHPPDARTHGVDLGADPADDMAGQAGLTGAVISLDQDAPGLVGEHFPEDPPVEDPDGPVVEDDGDVHVHPVCSHRMQLLEFIDDHARVMSDPCIEHGVPILEELQESSPSDDDLVEKQDQRDPSRQRLRDLHVFPADPRGQGPLQEFARPEDPHRLDDVEDPPERRPEHQPGDDENGQPVIPEVLKSSPPIPPPDLALENSHRRLEVGPRRFRGVLVSYSRIPRGSARLPRPCRA